MVENFKLADYAPGFLLSVFLLIAALLGGIFFVYYFYIIGRPDLIMSVMLDTSTGFYVFFGLLMLGMIAFVLQFLPSALFVISHSILKEISIEGSEAVKLCTINFLSSIVTMLLLVVGAGYFDFSNNEFNAIAITFTVIVAVCNIIFLNISCYERVRPWAKILVLSVVLVFFTVASWLFFLMLFENVVAYSLFKEASDLVYLALGAVSMSISLLPGYIWIKVGKERIFQKFLACTVVMAVVAFIVFTIAPDMTRVMTFNAGKAVGLHSNEESYYMLRMNSEDIERFTRVWSGKQRVEKGIVIGKTLFNFGGVELICPSDKILTARALLDSDNGLGAECILLRSTDFMKGPQVR